MTMIEANPLDCPGQIWADCPTRKELAAQLDDAVTWITVNIVGNEVRADPLPASLRPLIAAKMVEHPLMGWPDTETAQADLDTFRWE